MNNGFPRPQKNSYSKGDAAFNYTSRRFGGNWISAITEVINSKQNQLAYWGAYPEPASIPDGVFWTTQTSNFGTTNIFSVAYGNSLWVAGGNTGQIRT
jgi:hypothetical protein